MEKDIKNVETVNVPNSSMIMEVGYDNESKVLFVRFKGNAVYAYSNVPPEMFGKIMEVLHNQESVGKFFTKNIRGKFPTVKL